MNNLTSLNLPTIELRSGISYFTMTPNCVLNTLFEKQNHKLQTTYTRLLAYYSKASYKKGAFPSQKTLARELGISERAVKNHIRDLKKLRCSDNKPLMVVIKHWEGNISKNTYFLPCMSDLFEQSQHLLVNENFSTLLS